MPRPAKSAGRRHPFERELLARARKLLAKGPRPGVVVVGASGGPDSTALLIGLSALAGELEISVTAAHLDHGLRGEAAREDRDFVSELAAKLGCPFVDGKANDLSRRSKGRGIEAAAREARYAFLEETARRAGAAFVAVAHTRTDQAETVLMRILRGSGLRGIAAMPESRRIAHGSKVRLVRPLLSLSRRDVLGYLEAKGVVAREDSMNSDPRLKRTLVRKELLPLAETLVNPRAEVALARAARAARGASRVVEREARSLLRRAARSCGKPDLAGPSVSLDRETLALADAAIRDVALARILRKLLPEKLARSHVNGLSKLVRSPGHGPVALPGGFEAWISGDRLSIGPRQRAPRLETGRERVDGARPLALPVPGRALDSRSGTIFEARLVSRTSLASLEPVRGAGELARFDRDRVSGTLAVRARRPGDRFVPLGSSGARTLKRFFIDRKIPLAERARVPIVTLDDRPIWVVGERIDDRFKVTPETREVLELRATPAGVPGDLS